MSVYNFRRLAKMADTPEVLAVDQEKINKFGNLNTQCTALKLELARLEKRKEGYEGLGETLELLELEHDAVSAPYQIGTAFIELPIDTAKDEAEKESNEIDAQIADLKDKIAGKKAEMALLRKALYDKFGKNNINLGEDDD